MYTLLLLFAYCLGSINSAIIICKIMGLPSPRSVGSGNPGATNVLRLGSKKAAGFTLAGDVLKGVIPVLLGHALHFTPPALATIACAATLGHIFPVFFRFKGGKGVATALGCFFAIHFTLGCAVGLTWLIIAGLSRYSSLASIIAMLTAPVYANYLLGPLSLGPMILLCLVIILRHKQNILKLVTGTESKIGQKKHV
jgi:glycerol-3-phosphate acyltransferase PlsY